MRPIHPFLRHIIPAAVLSFMLLPAVAQAPTTTAPGLRVTYGPLDSTLPGDASVADAIALYVPAGKSPSPFLAPGKFTAVWEGFISVDLRDNYSFQVELNGGLKVEVNGNAVIEGQFMDIATPPTRPVRLNKGQNSIKVHYTSPDAGDAYLRFHWSSPDFPFEPVSANALSHDTSDPELWKSNQLRKGRELLAENRCVQCHTTTQKGMLELSMDAPSFEGIGTRRNYDWMARWIADPKALRPTATMPKILHGATAKADSEAIAAYLASLKSPFDEAEFKEPEASEAAAGRQLFESLHCVACHNAPGTDVEAGKISLVQVREKFPTGALAAFLQKPSAHYEWIRMPNFKLTQVEALQLAAYLNSAAAEPAKPAAPSDSALLDKGRQLVQSTGCLNCHSLKLENKFAAKPLAALAADKWQQGCVADAHNGKAPHFGFAADELAALRAFAGTDRSSLARHVPQEFAARQVKHLNCADCHGKFDGFPSLPVLGGKLKPEWSKAFIAGEIKDKPRPWLEARMPAFPKFAEGLAHGMAMQNGYGPVTPPEPPVDMELAEIGRRMVGSEGGFSCIACHAVRDFGATQVFESAGLNLDRPAERLLYPFYHRWMNNPLRIDPQTKMPVYFDQGRSPLTDYLEGDASKQIKAVWEYLRLGEKMPLPLDAEQ